MSIQTKHVCDRCGKGVGQEYPRGILATKHRKIKLTALLGLGAHDYVDADYDLCKDCLNGLRKFLNGTEGGAG